MSNSEPTPVGSAQLNWDLTADDKAELESIETQIKAKNQSILGRLRLDLEEGIAIGRLLNQAQPIIKKIRPKILWAEYVKTRCGFQSEEYARRLKLLARWVDETPANLDKIKDVCLTEAMRLAGIVKVSVVTVASDVDEVADKVDADASLTKSTPFDQLGVSKARKASAQKAALKSRPQAEFEIKGESIRITPAASSAASIVAELTTQTDQIDEFVDGWEVVIEIRRTQKLRKVA